ncbi:DUF4148 domain-containing protein [bacterium M00.F.Ca.ET.228.01.1.1]|uniref:DUF4148 domain-containing protein n=1 Tax=Paraburkholderia phenoliruptrix TaxID=252970 RepID=UPI001092E537|nr:DUF4148 domain-containing protein [Paraburkholderia phenoliruptrix]TGP47765.1 DUF4148 domain-containing protein [bacterium M00.F.Ca.ET.228.01.1.1]TGS05557.1 DUF4148 domain-containing protein [bacterium M00.F.Ca.ET.191.01.1.1]TGU10493.1 DUF4148 domain-containing protein [bacterium M00.F.Ca.ET.155.01.1.1]MBW0445437.1 DUF4148 domain-containing protein [Paraburkholderia phenoliruptrix]MBW9096202.1 DUF4148 domain-containing protein [Paraburkholderia phenoliruptrix]
MKRNLLAGLALSLLASAPVFAQGNGIGHAGNYQTQPAATTSGKTRAEVKAELVAAYRDGSLPSLNRTTYPNKGLIGQTQAARIALQEGASGDVTRVATGQ